MTDDATQWLIDDGERVLDADGYRVVCESCPCPGGVFCWCGASEEYVWPDDYPDIGPATWTQTYTRAGDAPVETSGTLRLAASANWDYVWEVVTGGGPVPVYFWAWGCPNSDYPGFRVEGGDYSGWDESEVMWEDCLPHGVLRYWEGNNWNGSGYGDYWEVVVVFP